MTGVTLAAPASCANAPVQTGRVDSRLGHQGRRPGDDVERLDKIVGSDFEQPQAGPKDGGQDALHRMTCVVPSRYEVFGW